jgi:DNA-binding XRE family transcriptional regulator
MKLSDMEPFEEVLAEDLQYPAFRREWERTQVAREVAIKVLQYRVAHHLTQEQLAAELGVKQPAVARLEAGDHQPSVGMLRRLADRLGMEFQIRNHEFRVLTPGEDGMTA